jgi:hypothetical protein
VKGVPEAREAGTIASEIRAERPTEPTPAIATMRCDILRPKSAKTNVLAKGMAGINQSN